MTSSTCARCQKVKKEKKILFKRLVQKEVDRVECGRVDSDSLSHSISPRPPSSLSSMIYNTLTEIQWDHNDTDLKSQIYNTSSPSLTNYLPFPNIFHLSFSSHLQAFSYFPSPNIFLHLFLICQIFSSSSFSVFLLLHYPNMYYHFPNIFPQHSYFASLTKHFPSFPSPFLFCSTDQILPFSKYFPLLPSPGLPVFSIPR